MFITVSVFNPKKSNFTNPAFSAEYISNCVDGNNRSAEISFDGLVDYTDSNGGAEIAHKLLTRQKCDFSFGTAATGDTIYTGEGFISSCEISGTMEEAVTYSGTITVTGAITESTN